MKKMKPKMAKEFAKSGMGGVKALFGKRKWVKRLITTKT